MILHFELCDLCGGLQHGLPMQSFEVAGKVFDVGPCCQSKPFRVPRTPAPSKLLLRRRIELLIETEQERLS